MSDDYEYYGNFRLESRRKPPIDLFGKAENPHNPENEYDLPGIPTNPEKNNKERNKQDFINYD